MDLTGTNVLFFGDGYLESGRVGEGGLLPWRSKGDMEGLLWRFFLGMHSTRKGTVPWAREELFVFFGTDGLGWGRGEVVRCGWEGEKRSGVAAARRG